MYLDPSKMKIKPHNLFICILLIIQFPCLSAVSCDHTCGGRKLPFPFGFSAGCGIHLNCSAAGAILAGEFPVESVNAETILVNLPPTCGRPVEALRRLFTASFAPTSHNAILLHDCRNPSSGCLIPTTMVQTHFEQLDCAGNATISCYSEPDNATSFIDYRNLTRSGCNSLFSAISMEAYGNSSSVSLDVQIVRVGWWLRGGCRCSRNAKCVAVSPPPIYDGGPTAGYRCECLEGFAGDGFLDGEGCRKGAEACNPSNYLSGKCGGTTRVGVLVGGVVAGAALMVGLVMLFCFIKKRSKLRSKSKRSKIFFETAGITIPIYSYKEMEKSADFFSDKRRLGNGAYGTVYCGKLNGDEWVAIKRIRHRDSNSIDQVVNEIKLLSSVSHPNLVRLLGCSIEDEEQILVYEFMPNGTLSQHLQREKGHGLPWPARLTIAVETAQAISYLHNAMNPPIYHRDIKSSNILLDEDFKSKVADFGLSRLGMTESSHVSTAPQGTPGYLDPQYHQHFHLSDKSDVYSFGVVLIEMITSLRVVDFGRPQNEVNLAALAVDKIGKGRLDEIIDPFLKNSMDLSVHKVAELAFRCLAFHRDMRPSMMEVAIELEQIRMSEWSEMEMGEKPLKVMASTGKHEYDSVGLFSSMDSSDTVTNFSPISAGDSWQSDQSSPSSNSLLNRVTR